MFERRKDYIFDKSSILFLMPPNIGLGDAVEYAMAIETITKKKKFKLIGIGFTSQYDYIFLNFFKFKNVYKHLISEENLKKYDTIFHFTKEIVQLKNQKYDRADIEKVICNYFKTNIKRKVSKKIKKIKKLTIFPISTSPIRTMPTNLINAIISEFSKKIKIEIVLDDFYPTSSYLLTKIKLKN